MTEESSKKSIFSKIIDGEVDSEILYQDDDFFVIKDIRPQAPVHLLIITKKQFATLEEIELENRKLHGKMLQLARKMADKFNIADNYKILINVGTRIQEVHHFHLHLMGGWGKEAKQETQSKNSQEARTGLE